MLVIACAAALGVAGCGGDDDETTSSTSSTTSTTSATGATGADDSTSTTSDSDAPEGTEEVTSLLETAFTAQGLSSGEAKCVADLVAPTVAGESVDKLQDPAYVEDLLSGQKSDIEECEGK